MTDHTRRDLVLAVVASAAIAPLVVMAQHGAGVRRIGLLSLGDPGVTDEERKQFWAPARELGWIEGENLLVEPRYAREPALLRPMADELVRLEVDAIVTSGTDAALAAKSATATIPIIMYSAGDPVRAGLVASLAHPGGNVTGFSNISPELDVKRLELVRDLLPGVQRVGVLFNPTNPMSRISREDYAQTFNLFRMQPIFVEVTKPADLETAVEEVTRQRAQALILPGDGLFREPIVRVALRHRLPTIVAERSMLEAGGLALYDSGGIPGKHRRYLTILDKILREAKPADIPIEQPTTFEFLINPRTAQELGLTIPNAVLLRADEVIR